MKPIASLSLDLDNQWSYMKTHGDAGWEAFPSYLDIVVPRVLAFLKERDLKITFFIVGQDAALEKNHKAIASIAEAGHLPSLEQPEAVAARRGRRVEDIAPAALLRARDEVPEGVSQEVTA